MASAADDDTRQRRKAEMTMMTMMAHTGSSRSHRRRLKQQPPPMRCGPLLFTILPLLLLLFNVVEAMPLQLKIRHGEKECFLESLTAGYVYLGFVLERA
jgi:hypothetical protein